jgi:DNA-binding transcriptional LysR family regulator
MTASHPRDTARHGSLTDITQLRVFVAVVDTASFSGAARRLSMTPSTVSRHIGDLEARLGAMLVSRTTRHLVITEAGKRFHEHCVNILDELGAAEAEAEQYTREPKGVLRVTAPAVLAQRHISPHLPGFLGQYPGLGMDMILTSQTLDLVSAGIDVAIRVTAEVDPGLVAIRLAPNRRVFAASPDYLERHGAPQSPDDLAAHNCLTSRSERSSAPWPMRRGNKVVQQRVHGNLIADNGEILLEATLQGTGIAMLPMFLAAPYLRSRRLVSVLERHAVDNISIFAVLPHRKYVPRKTRCFIDFMKGLFGPPPPWER